MVLKVSSRGAVPPFIVMDVLRAANERAATGEDVLHLELGQPGTPAPSGVIEAAKRALDAEKIGYTAVSLDRIGVTTGSSGGFVLAFIAAFDTGDRVALAAPGYPAYRNILLALGIEPVSLPAGPDSRFQPTVDLLERVDGNLDGLIVSSPSNPSGTMLSADELKKLADYCHDRGIRLISDEIYHGITYSMTETTALGFTDEAVVINSFSKYLSMTGWRIGWMVAPEDLLRSIECLKQNLFIWVSFIKDQIYSVFYIFI